MIRKGVSTVEANKRVQKANLTFNRSIRNSKIIEIQKGSLNKGYDSIPI